MQQIKTNKNIIYKRDFAFMDFSPQKQDCERTSTKTPRSHRDYGAWKVFTREITY